MVFLFRILPFLLPLIAGTFGGGLIFDPSDGSTCYGHKQAGGTQAEDHEFPSLVSLQLSSTGHFCAGSIISSKWIITAATCLKGLDAEWLNIVAGKDSLIIDEPTKQIRTAKRYVIHPNFTEEAVSNNVALIKLTGHLNTNMEEIRPVNLAAKNYKENGTGIACGWRFLPDNLLETGTVRKMNVSLFTVQECLTNYGPNYLVSDKTVCTGPVDRKICVSDPGGPLLCKNKGSIIGEADELVLCGVASREIKSDQGKIPPKLYARISKVRSWIKSVTRI